MRSQESGAETVAVANERLSYSYSFIIFICIVFIFQLNNNSFKPVYWIYQCRSGASPLCPAVRPEKIRQKGLFMFFIYILPCKLNSIKL